VAIETVLLEWHYFARCEIVRNGGLDSARLKELRAESNGVLVVATLTRKCTNN